MYTLYFRIIYHLQEMSTSVLLPFRNVPSICDLAWEDVVFPNIFARLTIKDCFNLRSTSKECQSMVDEYFKKIRRIDLSQYKSFTPSAFEVCMVIYLNNIMSIFFLCFCVLGSGFQL